MSERIVSSFDGDLLGVASVATVFITTEAWMGKNWTGYKERKGKKYCRHVPALMGEASGASCGLALVLSGVQ
jgi:hypothetical protein